MSNLLMTNCIRLDNSLRDTWQAKVMETKNRPKSSKSIPSMILELTAFQHRNLEVVVLVWNRPVRQQPQSNCSSQTSSLMWWLPHRENSKLCWCRGKKTTDLWLRRKLTRKLTKWAHKVQKFAVKVKRVHLWKVTMGLLSESVSKNLSRMIKRQREGRECGREICQGEFSWVTLSLTQIWTALIRLKKWKWRWWIRRRSNRRCSWARNHLWKWAQTRVNGVVLSRWWTNNKWRKSWTRMISFRFRSLTKVEISFCRNSKLHRSRFLRKTRSLPTSRRIKGKQILRLRRCILIRRCVTMIIRSSPASHSTCLSLKSQ